jgi:hypothetical protein
MPLSFSRGDWHEFYASYDVNRIVLVAADFDARQIRKAFLQQSKAGANLRCAHLTLSIDVLDEGIENIALLDFNPVVIRHPKTGLSSSGHYTVTADISRPGPIAISRTAPVGT